MVGIDFFRHSKIKLWSFLCPCHATVISGVMLLSSIKISLTLASNNTSIALGWPLVAALSSAVPLSFFFKQNSFFQDIYNRVISNNNNNNKEYLYSFNNRLVSHLQILICYRITLLFDETSSNIKNLSLWNKFIWNFSNSEYEKKKKRIDRLCWKDIILPL